jgi:hypothetical protein
MPYSPAGAAQLRRSVHSWIFAAPRHLGTGPPNWVSAHDGNPANAIASVRDWLWTAARRTDLGGAASLRGRRCRLRRAIRRQFVAVCAAQARQQRFLAECGGRIIVPAAMLLKMRAHRPEIRRYWSADYPNCQFASPVPLRGRRRGRVVIQLKAQAPLWRLLPASHIQDVRRKGIWDVWSASPPAGQYPASMPCRALALRRASEAAADLALGPAAPLGRKLWKQRSRLARSARTAEVRSSNPLSSATLFSDQVPLDPLS